MSYKNGAKQLLNVIRTVDGLSTVNTSQEDWGILSSGSAEVYAILRPGSHTTEPVSIGQRTVHPTWNTVIELWTIFDNVAGPISVLKRYADEIIEAIALYPYLGDSSTILSSLAISAEEMLEKQLVETGPLWATWDVTVGWLEERQIVPLE